jgi:inner membrane protein
MPTVLSHPAVALAVAPWYRDLARRPGAVATGMLLTVLPDLDVVSFHLGISYSHMLGHRGLTHSLPFAVTVSGLLAAMMAKRLQLSLPVLWSYFALCLASHGILDAFTSGGYGTAFFAPFSDTRYFFGWRPVRVSPIGIDAFLSARGVLVMKSEFWTIWLPCAAIGAAGLLWRYWRRRRTSH